MRKISYKGLLLKFVEKIWVSLKLDKNLVQRTAREDTCAFMAASDVFIMVRDSTPTSPLPTRSSP
jgi:hypothetical protein